MMRTGRFFLLLAVLLLPVEASRGQRVSSWRSYRLADGLPEAACLSVTVSPRGKVLVRHPGGESISELDGYEIWPVPGAGSGPARVYESPGGQLWTINAYGLSEFRDSRWLLHPISAIAAATNAEPAATVPFFPVRQGRVLFLLPDRLMELNSEDPNEPRTEMVREATQTGLGRFLGMTRTADGGLWITGSRGLVRLPNALRSIRETNEWRQFIAPDSLHVRNLRQPIEAPDGSIVAVAENSTNGLSVILQFDGQRWTAHETAVDNLTHAWSGPDALLWAVTPDSLFRFRGGRPEVVESDDLSVRRYFDVAVEPDGKFWLATSDGLFRYTPPSWRTPAAFDSANLPVRRIAEDTAGRLWFLAGAHLCTIEGRALRSYPLPDAGGSADPDAAQLVALRDGTLLAGGDGKIFRFGIDTGVFSPVESEPPGRRLTLLGLLKDGTACVQSGAGAGPQTERSLHIYDGTLLRPFPDKPPPAVLSDDFRTLHATLSGSVWFGGAHGAARYSDRKWQLFALPQQTSEPDLLLHFVELADGRTWAASRENIWQFDGRSWSLVRAGFDHINAMLRWTRDGSIWVATDGGLHRFFQETWLENQADEGLPGAEIECVHEDQRGRIWAGAAHGLSSFRPENDMDPPQTFIHTMTDRETAVPEGGTITLAFFGRDKWKHTPRDRLLFSHRLDEHNWSPFVEETAVSFADLAAGKHYFQVRAMDRNGNINDANPAQFTFAVTVPWYQETRLVIIGFLGLAGALFFASLAFNRHRRLVRSYAEVERKVAERTRELAIANRELLQSQKMTALGTLAAGIAHDFNNILSIIKGSAQIIEENLDKPDKVRTRIDRIKTVVEQGSGVVKAMLGFSRTSDQQEETCDLNAVVGDTIKLLGDRFLREVEIRFEAQSDLPELRQPKHFIQQILINFIFNAADAMTDRRQILLSTGRFDKPPSDVVLPPAPAPAYVTVSVQDFGSGIAADVLPRIFEPFFTTKALSTQRGTGLGLSMVYELARKMEAGLAVRSTVNQGSTFTLILPARSVRQTSAVENRANQPSLSR